jgi:quercetin dioxygenase-like cupin family protein
MSGEHDHLADNIKAVREARGLSQQQIAKAAGIPRAMKAADLITRTKTGVTVRKLLPESLPGLDLERMSLPPGVRMAGVPHTPGTREYLTCERGVVELHVSGERYLLEEGDVVTFRGDQRHSYHNPGKEAAVAYSVIAFAPVTS